MAEENNARIRRDGVVRVIAEEKCVKVTKREKKQITVVVKQASCGGDASIIRDPYYIIAFIISDEIG